MRKIIVSEFVSLDGVTEAPERWSLDYWNDGIAAFKHDELFSVDALLLGRVTYQGFAASWPTRSGDPYTDRMNALPKFVATRTVKDLTWNATPLAADLADDVERLKSAPGQDILVFGSSTFANALSALGLVDEYRLLVYPVVLGSGRRLFPADAQAKLKLARTQQFGDVVALTYTP